MDLTREKYIFFNASGLLNSEQQHLRKLSFDGVLFLILLTSKSLTKYTHCIVLLIKL